MMISVARQVERDLLHLVPGPLCRHYPARGLLDLTLPSSWPDADLDSRCSCGNLSLRKESPACRPSSPDPASLEGRVGFEPTTPGLKGTDRGLIAKALDSKSGVKPG
jgi:hypothetical protein